MGTEIERRLLEALNAQSERVETLTTKLITWTTQLDAQTERIVALTTDVEALTAHVNTLQQLLDDSGST
jgi:ABC-type transporter Mla subunit MlaD